MGIDYIDNILDHENQSHTLNVPTALLRLWSIVKIKQLMRLKQMMSIFLQSPPPTQRLTNATWKQKTRNIKLKQAAHVFSIKFHDNFHMIQFYHIKNIGKQQKMCLLKFKKCSFEKYIKVNAYTYLVYGSPEINSQ